MDFFGIKFARERHGMPESHNNMTDGRSAVVVLLIDRNGRPVPIIEKVTPNQNVVSGGKLVAQDTTNLSSLFFVHQKHLFHSLTSLLSNLPHQREATLTDTHETSVHLC